MRIQKVKLYTIIRCTLRLFIHIITIHLETFFAIGLYLKYTPFRLIFSEYLHASPQKLSIVWTNRPSDHFSMLQVQVWVVGSRTNHFLIKTFRGLGSTQATTFFESRPLKDSNGILLITLTYTQTWNRGTFTCF